MCAHVLAPQYWHANGFAVCLVMYSVCVLYSLGSIMARISQLQGYMSAP